MENGVCQIKHLGWGAGKAPERRKADRDFQEVFLKWARKLNRHLTK